MMSVNLRSYPERSGYLQGHLEVARETIQEAIDWIDRNPQEAKSRLRMRLASVEDALRQVEEAQALISAETAAAKARL